MAITIESHITSTRVPAAVVERAVAHTLRALKRPRADVSVQLCADARVAKLNAAYRGKEGTTDVLSFPVNEEGFPMPLAGDELGDLVLSVPQIVRQAKANHIPVAEEATRMLVHGTLHLAGYDHIDAKDRKIMFALQETLVLEICV